MTEQELKDYIKMLEKDLSSIGDEIAHASSGKIKAKFKDARKECVAQLDKLKSELQELVKTKENG